MKRNFAIILAKSRFAENSHPQNFLYIICPRKDKSFSASFIHNNNSIVTMMIMIDWFYLTRKTGNNNWCKIATSKQKKTMELVHNSA